MIMVVLAGDANLMKLFRFSKSLRAAQGTAI